MHPSLPSVGPAASMTKHPPPRQNQLWSMGTAWLPQDTAWLTYLQLCRLRVLHRCGSGLVLGAQDSHTGGVACIELRRRAISVR